jgi:hypothetical protein
MKKLTTLFLILSVSRLIAQTDAATPNANFEHWTHNSKGYDDVNGWNDLNSSTSTFGDYTLVKDSSTADVKSGKYAVRLITENVVIETAPGALTTGTINTSNKTISGGLPYTLRPDSITGWYKYTSVSGDNADIEFYLFGSGGSSDTIGEAFFKTPTSTVSKYTHISYPVSYRSSNPVVTALWILSSSINQAGAQVGSQLFADSLGLIFNPTGINTIKNADEISVGPNPASTNIYIRNVSNSSSLLFNLFDITGRKISVQTPGLGTSTMDVSTIPDGVYIYSITDKNNASIKTGRIVIQK